MRNRNLSPLQMFLEMAREHQPQCGFEEGADFAAWKKQTLPRVMATLGDFPPCVEPDAELLAEWEHDGLRKQRWVLDVGPHISATLQINYPADWKGEKRAAILCWHGHGPYGKEPVMGSASPHAQADIQTHNYDYGHQMAKAGFITWAIDWMGMGERHDSRKPNHHQPPYHGGDWCNIYYLHATMLGYSVLSMNLAQGRVATDFVCSLPGVDEKRLGVMGLSGGGTMTIWSALCEERFRAAEIICYSDLWELMGVRDNNYCGMQVAPGLYKLVDMPDLQGLIAPRPLLVDIGVHDSCFVVDGALKCFRKVEKIYEAAGAREKLELDLFPGEHAWGGNKSIEFFRKHL
jgi:hypothetical protein